MIKRSLTINAPIETVFKVIMSYKESDPKKRRVLSSTPENSVVEEIFQGPPLVGNSRVVYNETPTSDSRIEFSLVESDKLSVFQGSWELFDTGNGSTRVEVESSLDISIPIPFKESFLKAEAEKDIDQRLAYIKKNAETA